MILNPLNSMEDQIQKKLSSKSHADDEVIDSRVDSIVSCCSATEWSVRRHYVRPLSAILVKIDAQENNKNELVTLHALHLKVSKAEMFDDCKSSLANNALERTAF